MASKDEVLIRVRAQGGKAAAKDIAAAEKQLAKLKKTSQSSPGSTSLLGKLKAGLRSIGPGSRVANVAMGQVRRTSQGLASDFVGVAKGIRHATVLLTGLSGAGAVFAAGRFVKSGIDLNAQWQSAETSFSTLLGSVRKGTKYMKDLQQVSDGTALRLTEAMSGAQQLLGQGVAPNQSLKLLKALNAAIIANGKGTEQFESGARTLGQMFANQKVSLQDVNQLAEGAELNVRQILAKGLVYKSGPKKGQAIGGQGVANIGNLNVPSEVALQVITDAWQKKFGKAAKAAESNWQVRTKNMVKDWEKFKRVTTSGLFEGLNERVLPQLQGALKNAINTMSREDLSFGDKIKITWAGVKKDLGPLASELKKGIDGMHLGKRISDGIEEWSPKIISTVATAFANAAPAAWRAFKRAWGNMGGWGKVLTVAFLWRRLRLPFWSLGGKLGGAIGSGALGGLRATMGANGAVSGLLSGRMGKVGMVLGRTMGAAMALYAGYEILKHREEIAAKARSISKFLGTESDDVTTSDGKAVNAWSQYEAQKRIKSGDSYTEGDLRTLAAMLRSQGAGEPEIARKMQELRGSGRYRKRATGGRVQPGETTLVGERGPELAQFPAGTNIVPNRDLGRAAKSHERVVIRRETPIILRIDGKTLLEVLSVQTERAVLAH